MSKVSHERLRECLDYDPDTGVFTWRGGVECHGTRIAGTRAGNKSFTGYWRLRIDRKEYDAHRVAWFYVHGYWPRMLDHINGVRDDNRMANLREATGTDNRANTKRPKSNTSGVKGVTWNKSAGKWQAAIACQRKHFFLGVFDDIKDAEEAYAKAARDKFGKFARLE